MVKIRTPAGRRYEANYPVKVGQVIINLLQQIIVLLQDCIKEIKRGHTKS